MPGFPAIHDPEMHAVRTRANQQQLAAQIKPRFHYIVCGAGTAGCVVAGRLAADPDVQVLLLEAGGSDDLDLVMNPNRWPMTLGSELDWGFVAEPNPQLHGRAIPYNMGRVLGGGSSINVGTWSRGHGADWDHYAIEAGDHVWDHESVVDVYRERIEAWTGEPDPERRGTGGAVHVQPATELHPFSLALIDAAQALGLPRFRNANGQLMESAGGCSLVDDILRDGKRQSLFRTYVYPLMDRPNLTVLSGATVAQIAFDRDRAVGVDFEYRGTQHRAAATREIIVSLGAVQTPKLLMQSGIGEPAELARAGVPVRLALPGVGRGLHDHVAFGCLWETTHQALPLAPRSQTVCFWKTDPTLDAPNFFAYARRGAAISPENAARFAPPAGCWSLSIGMRPHSRGSVHLTGPRPSDPVRIDANYLGDPRDLADLRAGCAFARELGNAAALRPFRGREIAPGPLDDAALVRFFRDGLTTFWHPCGTARMGRDARSVVDSKLRVHGLTGLRVADASILPRVTTGDTMAPCVVIGEQAAAFMQRAR